MLPLLVLLAIASCQYPWIKPDELNYGLPPSVSIYTLRTNSSPFNTKLTGGYAKFNMNDSSLEFVVKDTIGDALGYFPKTPVEYAEQGNTIEIQNKTWFMLSSTEATLTWLKTPLLPSFVNNQESRPGILSMKPLISIRRSELLD